MPKTFNFKNYYWKNVLETHSSHFMKRKNMQKQFALTHKNNTTFSMVEIRNIWEISKKHNSMK